MLENIRLVLASRSPRRQELLSQMDLHFDIVVKPVDEKYPDDLPPEEIAIFLSQKKAMAFTPEELGDNTVIITADTIVCSNGEILNKPLHHDEAREMLRKLSGKQHDVITGVTLRAAKDMVSFADITEVYFRDLSESEIEYYITHYQPFDKAGAYGIQEWIGLIGITRINGSYFNVVGLPTTRLYTELLQFCNKNFKPGK